jgi:two-component system sensor kinase FixL
MTAGLAHELNQPLTAIQMYADAALELSRSSESAELRGALERISEESIRAAEIIRRTRAFIRRGPYLRAPHDVNRLIRDSLRLFEGDLRSRRIELGLLLDETPPVVVDEVQIQQVLVNLIRNAVDSLSGSDSVSRLLTVVSRRADDFVRIQIRDTGAGIAPDVAANLFEPFQTTKPNGLGLGLAICRTLIEAHGGRIGADAIPTGGASFRIELPICPE